jgi:hypothetical protein
MEDAEKRKFLTLPGLELRPLGHPVRSQSPYPLRYPGSMNMKKEVEQQSIVASEYVVMSHKLER